jgi:lycopene beta-cyclase
VTKDRVTTTDWDAVIAGGGLSGLSLAAHLAADGWHDRRVLVVDDPDGPKTDAWAFWAARPIGAGVLDAAVCRSFDRVRIYAAGATATVGLGRYRYRVVRRRDLRRVVLSRLSACPGFELIEAHVDAVTDAGDMALTSIGGQAVRSAWAFDGVTRDTDAPPAAAHLAFTGWDIVAEQPLFDPDTPVLMDFRVAPGAGCRFVYTLPRDAHRALVELTEFVPRRAAVPTEAERSDVLASYLRDVAGCRTYDVRRREAAVIPLRTGARERDRGRVVRIGAAGGLIKASTGYAYQRIQRDSEAIVASLVTHTHPSHRPQSRWRHRLLDAVLLEVLDRNPGQLEIAFSRLFRGHPAERVLAFLDEDTTRREELALISSLPSRPYVQALLARSRR